MKFINLIIIVMNKTMVILAHPDLNNSRVNRRWKEELEKYKDKILVHDLYGEYSDWNIDVAKEQDLMEKHDNIILQFPFYWYSSPPLLKKWIDEVFTYDWAYGDDEEAEYKLKNKKIGLAVTVGGPEKEHNRNGLVSYTIDELLSPFTATIKYVNAIPKGNFILYDSVPETGDEIIDESAERYLEYILKK